MSVSVNVFHTVEVAGQGAYLAHVKNDQLYIYPEGSGRGPVIIMPRADWARISREVMLAFSRADRQGVGPDGC